MPDTMIPDPLQAHAAPELTPAQVFALYPPHGDTLPSLLASRAAAIPDAEALLFQSRSWTYRQLQDGADALAAVLAAPPARAA